MNVDGTHYRTVWLDGSTVKTIDQPLIPHRFEILDLADYRATADAITTMIVRGAGAIGATGAYGMAQAMLQASPDRYTEEIEEAARVLAATRPTAQNLFYGIEKVQQAIREAADYESARREAVRAAETVADEDAAACEKIGEFGAELIADGARILTHCNAGWLAFVDWGSALSPVYRAARDGKKVFVYADETRPRCQGARLTAWELCGEKIPHALIADNAAGYYMARGEIDLVIVGSDRIARNGDVANKIGTYTKAVLARRHGIPFYVAAPTTTIDFDCPTGADIPIEERHEDEVLCMWGRDADTGDVRRIRIAPAGSHALNPAFDVTPAELVTGIVTQKGVFAPADLAKNESTLRA
ncbi:S-methyl-5-thioribose-1-phosphate isomerase [Candidatus Sumerlaeota bacterium]|nr:S-methyl-5-thioribose-1-phosphate isomerase [Candidatus Sumerlaeota bacterium]